MNEIRISKPIKLANFTKAIFLWGGAAIFFVIAARLLIMEKSVSAATSGGFGIILIFVANIERIAFLKGFGLEAKTRDLKCAISEAEHILGKLEKTNAQVKVLADNLMTLRTSAEQATTELDRKLAKIDERGRRAESLANSSLAHDPDAI